MDTKTAALIAITVIVLIGIVGGVFVGRAAFAKDASELGKEEAELMLRIGTVALILVASIFFGILDIFDKAVGFLGPLAAFVLGGIRSNGRRP